MSGERDPLWKAVVEGDKACPDGEALVALGQLMREHSQVKASAGFADKVLAACKEVGSEDALIDAFYDNDEMSSAGAADPALAKLRKVARQSAKPPEPVDLVPEILDNLHRSSARHELASMDRVTRLRVWATVIVGHVAALVTIVILHGQVFKPDAEFNSTTNNHVMAPNTDERMLITEASERLDIAQLDEATSQAMADGLPLRWSQIRGQPEVLFLLRQHDKLKTLYNEFYGADACQATVQAALSWMREQQRDSGSFAAAEARSGSRYLASHSVAMLALMAEGFNESNKESLLKAGEFLQSWYDESGTLHIGDDQVSYDVANGMAALAMVELALLSQDDALKSFAELIISQNIPHRRNTQAGLDGYFLLAMETAQVGGIAISADDLAAIRHRARTGNKKQDVGHLGLLALSRYLYGYRDSKKLHQQLDIIAGSLPQNDDQLRSDPLRWFFPSLAVREAGGEHWKQWNQSLQRSLLPCFHYDNQKNHAWVEHEEVRFASDDVFATGLVLLNLQAATRYIPLARGR